MVAIKYKPIIERSSRTDVNLLQVMLHSVPSTSQVEVNLKKTNSFDSCIKNLATKWYSNGTNL